MFAYIKGIIKNVSPTHVVIEAGSIGYALQMANPFRLSSALEQERVIYVYQSVTQDDIRLFGFINEQEKNLFLKLINVSGIGPKSALSILALEDHVGLVRAIEEADTAYLQKFPGVGKKTASQIILDLQGKLADLSPEIMEVFGGEEDGEQFNASLDEALEALAVLGYTKRDLKRAEKHLADLELGSPDEYIREALSILIH